MDPQHDSPVKPVQLRRRTMDDILRGTIVNQAIQIASLMAIADEVPGLRAEIVRLTGELEKVLLELAELHKQITPAPAPEV